MELENLVQRSFRSCLALTCCVWMMWPTTSLAEGYPRVGGLLLTNKADVIKPQNEDWLSVADVVVIGPSAGAMEQQYVEHFSQIKSVNTDLMLFRYINITALNVTWGGWESTVAAMSDYFVNPNRGGANTAKDGWARTAAGDTSNPWGNNTSINILDYVAPYDGSKGVASSDSDMSKPKRGERPVDFMGRQNYHRRVAPIESILDGVYEDVNRRWPKVTADWNNDGSDSGKNEGAGDIVARKWREAMMHGRDNFVGPNFDGRNAPMGRSSGRAWMSNGGYYLVNGSSWLQGTEGKAQLDKGTLPAMIPEYDQQFHGGNHESVFGLETSRGGLRPNGTATSYGSAAKSLNAGLASFNFSYAHAKPIPELGHAAFIFETQATTLDMARYCLAAGLMADGLVHILNNNEGKTYAPWMLDEMVGEDYAKLNKQQIYARNEWLGNARDSAFPNNPIKNNGRVFLREFQNGLVVLLAGRAHRDDHMTAVETVQLPSPGAGFRWARISGGQDSAWNDGSLVGDTIRLGTSAANINRNAIILRRVSTNGNEPPPAPPQAPEINVE